MTVGIQIYNNNNENIIDGVNPAYSLASSGTMNGTYIASGRYRYDVSFLGADRPVFFQLNVGDHLVGYNYLQFESNRSSLAYRSVASVIDFAPPTGYGLVLYNSSGQMIWVAQYPIAIINAYATIPYAGTYSTSSDWVCLLTTLPWWAPTGAGISSVRSPGVIRESSLYRWHAVPVGTVGSSESIGPFSVSCMFAKS